MFFRKPANVKGPRRPTAPRPTPGQLLTPEPRRELSIAEAQLLLQGLRKIAHSKTSKHKLYVRGLEPATVDAQLANPVALSVSIALGHSSREFPRYEFQFRLSRRRRLKVVGTLLGHEFHVEAASVVTVG